jgi:hypothetical protein
MSSRPKRCQAGCSQPSDEEELAREDAVGHNVAILRLKSDLLAMVKREGEMLQDALAN